MQQEPATRHTTVNASEDGVHPCAARPLLFISDLHLSEAMPRTAAAFEHFVRMTASAEQAGAVFILGDLFEYWVGDDVLGDSNNPFATRIAALLHTLSERGIALYVMHGNRDFLLGPRFMKAAGAIWLPDPTTITAFGARIALAHGDALCTGDRRYQWFRRFVRNRLLQRLFLVRPYRRRAALARRMRAKSEAARAHPAPPHYDVTPEGVAALFARSSAATMIHGHTHRSAQHHEPDGTRWVLPDWDLDHGAARGGYLRIDATGIRMLPLD